MPDIFIATEKPKQKVSKKEPKNETYHAPFQSRYHHRLSSFSLHPENVGFETREKEEKIILFLRQHPVVNVKWILITAIMIVVPELVKLLGILSSLPTGPQIILIMVWYLITMAYAFESFLGWYFNVYFVTNERVIDVDFYNLIDKRVSEASLSKIQDVSYTTAGVFGTLFNYGDVFIQTAAEVSEFQFDLVPFPEKVIKVLGDLKTKHRGGHT